MKTSGYKFLGLLLGAALLLLSGASCAPAQDTSRKILKRVKVEYPPLLKEHHIGGTVRLRVTVRADGTVRDTELVGGSPVLGDCAEKSVKQWIFAPGAAESIEEVSFVFNPAHSSGE
jgi:TonB family protein